MSDEDRARYLGRHVQPPPLFPEPKARVEILRRWIATADAAAAKLDDSGAGWIWCELALRVDGLLAPTGRLHPELERILLLEADQQRDAFRAIAARKDLENDLEYAYARHEPGQPLGELSLQQECQVDGPASLAIACYTPADMLRQHAMGPGLAELLSLPFRLLTPEAFPPAGRLDLAALPAALARAIDAATEEWPSLRMRADRIDCTSIEAFVLAFHGVLEDQKLDAKAKRAARPKQPKKAAPEPDWQAIEDAIVAGGVKAAKAFGGKHKKAAALILDTDPPAGYVLYSFETAEGLLAHARGHLASEAKRRKAALDKRDAWKHAKGTVPALADLISPGDFEHMDYDRIELGEAMAKFDAADPPDSPGERYVLARFRVAITRALDRLAAGKTLQPLVGKAAPLIVGYTFHDEPAVVLHLLT